ncbi:hypothetical protein EYF80_055808 [Liparis tanakae]|uniref:Uncharacterized protein n=1 Tax=Liparis tanakae TaxID=230148 RepID=A0A4Z2EZ32_9TELE|nr:hypothetical protein EYF80_055808 [Liparis tanakae]
MAKHAKQSRLGFFRYPRPIAQPSNQLGGTEDRNSGASALSGPSRSNRSEALSSLVHCLCGSYSTRSNDSRDHQRRSGNGPTDGAQIEDDWAQIEDDGAQIKDVWAQIEDDGAQVEDDGAQIEDDWAQIEDDGAQIEDDGAQIEDDGAQIEDDGAQIEDDGAQIEDDQLHRIFMKPFPV